MPCSCPPGVPRRSSVRARGALCPRTASPRTRRWRSPPPSATGAGGAARRERPSPSGVSSAAPSAPSSIASSRSRRGRSGWSPTTCGRCCAPPGIEFAASELTPPADAAATAERLGYPLVAKAVSPGLLHKSDVGAVILDLDSAAAVASAVETLGARLGTLGLRLERVLLQRQVDAGIEALVGVTTDPTFGPLLVCGLGGVLVEVLRDVVHHLTPVTDVDARDMIGKLRAAPLLDGYRGQPSGDRDALAVVIQRVSALVEAVPEIRELDLNPVKVLPPGQGAIVVDGRMRIG